MHSSPDRSYNDSQSELQTTGTRQSFLDLLGAEIEYASFEEKHVAVLLVDIEQFCQVNLAVGYEGGDEVLLLVQRRLSEAIAKARTVQRLGDNLFGLVVPELNSPAFIQLAAEKIRKALILPFEVGGEKLVLRCHIGVAVSAGVGMSAAKLLLAAERSLRDARQMPGQKNLSLNNESQGQFEQWQIEKHLLQALDANDLQFLYQPQVDIQRHRPAGIEALVRWESAELGLLSPDEFLPVAEKTPLINRITDLGIQTAARQQRALKEIGIQVPISINMTASDIFNKNLPTNLESALNIWGIQPEMITLEVTESVIVTNPELAMRQLQILRDQGVKISIDDFGTGYSSLSYFKIIPADELKIDKSFISNICESDADAAIVELVINLAHKFGMHVVAEGVESLPVVERLNGMGCDIAQGYFFSEPLSRGSVSAWLSGFNPAKYWD